MAPRPSKFVVMVLGKVVHDNLDAVSGSGDLQDASYQKIKDVSGGLLYP